MNSNWTLFFLLFSVFSKISSIQTDLYSGVSETTYSGIFETLLYVPQIIIIFLLGL